MQCFSLSSFTLELPAGGRRPRPSRISSRRARESIREKLPEQAREALEANPSEFGHRSEPRQNLRQRTLVVRVEVIPHAWETRVVGNLEREKRLDLFHKFKLSEQYQEFNLMRRIVEVMSGMPSFWREYFLEQGFQCPIMNILLVSRRFLASVCSSSCAAVIEHT